MLVSTREAASVQKGRREVRRCGDDHGCVTPDWEVLCIVYPLEVAGGGAMEGCGREQQPAGRC